MPMWRGPPSMSPRLRESNFGIGSLFVTSSKGSFRNRPPPLRPRPGPDDSMRSLFAGNITETLPARPDFFIAQSSSSRCRKAGIVNLRFHDLRHEAASRLHEPGWPLHHVRELLGHASLSTTNTYLNVTRTELQASMRRTDEVRGNRCTVVASVVETEQPLPRNVKQETGDKPLID